VPKSGLTVRSVMLSATLAICITLSACAPTPSSQPSAAPAPLPSATPISDASTPTSTPSRTLSSVDSVTIDITISGGKVSPSGRKLDVAVGQKVVLNVTSDVDEEIHAHALSEGGYQLDVSAGQPATGSFVASDPGRFYVEAHHLEKVIVILNVR
jgi:heme/copper-type cytochrome/quinol oxidase subunit 2